MTATQLSLMDQPLHALEATIRTSLARRTDPATHLDRLQLGITDDTYRPEAVTA